MSKQLVVHLHPLHLFVTLLQSLVILTQLSDVVASFGQDASFTLRNTAHTKVFSVTHMLNIFTELFYSDWTISEPFSQTLGYIRGNIRFIHRISPATCPWLIEIPLNRGSLLYSLCFNLTFSITYAITVSERTDYCRESALNLVWKRSGLPGCNPASTCIRAKDMQGRKCTTEAKDRRRKEATFRGVTSKHLGPHLENSAENPHEMFAYVQTRKLTYAKKNMPVHNFLL